MKKKLEQILSLLVVFLMLVAASLWSGRLLGYELKPEAKPSASANLSSLTGQGISLPGFEKFMFTQVDTGIWQLQAPDGTWQGTALHSAHFAPDVRGFAGPVPIWIILDTLSCVSAVVPDVNHETPEFLERVKQLGFFEQWNGMKASDVAGAHYDAVSGATYTSTAVAQNVIAACASYEASTKKAAMQPTIGWTRAIAVLLVLLLGIAARLWLRKKAWVRLTILILNVLVTGLLCTQFLSLTQMLSWTENGVDWIGSLPLVAMLLTTIVMALAGKPNHYCTWACPYGSLQELAYRLPLPHIKVAPRFYATARRLRTFVLCLILLTAWLGVGADLLLQYEPFTAFLLDVATPTVLVLATSFVVLSMFVPNLWCKALCPMGELLQLGLEGNAIKKQATVKEQHKPSTENE